MVSNTILPYRFDIQVMRGIAISLVIAYHIGLSPFKNGFLGVDIFFVISGFLMANIYQSAGLNQFYFRRITRLIPAYLLSIFITLLVAIWILSPSDYAQTSLQAITAVLLIPNFYFWSRNSYFQLSDFNPLLHFWSLGVEIQFYFIVPIIAFLSRKYRNAILYLILLSFLACIWLISISPKTSFYLPPLRLWEFLIGYQISNYAKHSIIEKFKKVNSKIILFFAALMLIFALTWPINGFSNSYLLGHPGLGAFVVVVVTAIIILCNLKAPQNFVFKFFALIGDYSYILYLTHFPVLIFLNYKFFQGTSTRINSASDFILFLLICVSISVLIRKCIELPFMSSSVQARNFILAMVASLLLVFVSGSSLNLIRFNSEQRLISEAILNRDTYRCGKIVRLVNPFLKMCQLVKGSEKKILLLGNSHADSVKRVFKEVSDIRDYSLYFWVQNDPLMNRTSELDDVIREIERSAISEVIVHYSKDALTNETIFKLVIRLNEQNVNVKILGPVPTWPQSVPELMWSGSPKNSELKYKYDEYRKENNQLDFIEELSQKGLATYYDTGSFLCRKHCMYADERGFPLYFDSNHLNLTGAAKLRPLIELVLGS